MTFGQRLVRFIDAWTSAQQRQAAFRGRHGLSQAARYTAGLPPMNAQTRAMYEAEALQNMVDEQGRRQS